MGDERDGWTREERLRAEANELAGSEIEGAERRHEELVAALGRIGDGLGFFVDLAESVLEVAHEAGGLSRVAAHPGKVLSRLKQKSNEPVEAADAAFPVRKSTAVVMLGEESINVALHADMKKKIVGACRAFVGEDGVLHRDGDFGRVYVGDVWLRGDRIMFRPDV